MKSLSLYQNLLVILFMGLGSGVAMADPPNPPPGIANAVNAISNRGIVPGPNGVGSAVSCPVLQQLGSSNACSCCGSTPGTNGKGPKRALVALANAPSFISLQPVIDRIDAKYSSLPPLP